jgi:ubiquinone/menaquinone biosynthesis C-methylase UbiE
MDSIGRITRTREQARGSYDFISGFYDLAIAPFETRYSEMALRELRVKKGETVLEIGTGTGRALASIAAMAGEGGRACGIDISPRMCAIARRRLEKAGLKAELVCADAVSLPYPERTFDAVFSSFTLELFDTPDIGKVLGEALRVLKPGGRIVLISLSKESPEPILSRAYMLFHRLLPAVFDCRPIYVEKAVRDAGFTIKAARRVSWLGVPGRIVSGKKSAQSPRASK